MSSDPLIRKDDADIATNGMSLIERGWFLQYGDPVRGRGLAERGTELARNADDAATAALGELVLCQYDIRYARSEPSDAKLEAFGRVFAEHGMVSGQIRLAYVRAYLAATSGRSAEAYTELHAALHVLQSQAVGVDTFMIYNALGANATEAGRLEDGLRFSLKALAAARGMNSSSHQALILSNLGSMHHELGNYEDAIGFLAEAYQLVAAGGMQSMGPLVAGNLAMCQLAIHAHQSAYETISPYLDLDAERVRVGRSDRAFFEAIAAHTFAAQGDYPRASDMIVSALAHSEKSGDVRVLAHSWWVKGMIERGQGNLDGALVALKSAESLLGKMDDFFYPVQIHRELSQVYAEQADWASAYAYLDRYQKLYQQALGSAARARFYTLQIQAELDEAERERDFARLKQAEAERARSELEALNRELAAKVEEIERLQVQLREQAVRDPLTELYNRRYLQDELANEIKTAERRGGSFCVVLIDLDHFKRVNDEYGHPMGDKVLVELARLMRASIRGSDFACRFGGEEFCLVLVDISAEQAVARINDLRERLGRMVLRRGGQRLDHLTFSAGVAEYPTHGKTVDKLLQAADRALYRAKGSGRNCVLLAGREVARV